MQRRKEKAKSTARLKEKTREKEKPKDTRTETLLEREQERLQEIETEKEEMKSADREIESKETEVRSARGRDIQLPDISSKQYHQSNMMGSIQELDANAASAEEKIRKVLEDNSKYLSYQHEKILMLRDEVGQSQFEIAEILKKAEIREEEYARLEKEVEAERERSRVLEEKREALEDTLMQTEKRLRKLERINEVQREAEHENNVLREKIALQERMLEKAKRERSQYKEQVGDEKVLLAAKKELEKKIKLLKGIVNRTILDGFDEIIDQIRKEEIRIRGKGIRKDLGKGDGTESSADELEEGGESEEEAGRESDEGDKKQEESEEEEEKNDKKEELRGGSSSEEEKEEKKGAKMNDDIGEVLISPKQETTKLSHLASPSPSPERGGAPLGDLRSMVKKFRKKVEGCARDLSKIEEKVYKSLVREGTIGGEKEPRSTKVLQEEIKEKTLRLKLMQDELTEQEFRYRIEAEKIMTKQEKVMKTRIKEMENKNMELSEQNERKLLELKAVRKRLRDSDNSSKDHMRLLKKNLQQSEITQAKSMVSIKTLSNKLKDMKAHNEAMQRKVFDYETIIRDMKKSKSVALLKTSFKFS